jgi:hypothetical protein
VVSLNNSEEKPGEAEEPAQSSSRLWTPYGDPREGGYDSRSEAEGEDQVKESRDEEVSEEELRRRIEEAMEKITVTDVVVDVMVSLSSLAYQRMGIPHDVNEKYRDLDQARLAIDCIDALAKALEGRIPEDLFNPLKGTLDNLKLNYARES